jgi:hypothetical protein
MTPQEIQELLGGYATGTLTDADGPGAPSPQ